MAPLFAVEGVSVSIQRGSRKFDVLSDISLEINPGETIGIWGQRRSGRTTLANVAAGLVKPDRGRVLLGGVELPTPSRLHSRGLQEDIALVRCGARQSSSERKTVIAHVERHLRRTRGNHLRRRRMVRSQAWQALQRVGLDMYAGESLGSLPDRERLLLSITEALVPMPKLLVLDDFCLGMNAVERDEIRTMLHKATISEGLSILLTTDSMADLRGAAVIGSLADGQLRHSPRSDAQVIDFPAKKRLA